MPTTESLVMIDAVTKRFAEVVAVDNLTLTIEPGQFVTLLGPSGCGKSTCLRLLGGFETPDSGRIVIDGQDVTQLPPNRRHVNMVFQDYALFPHMSVAQNVAFGLELKGMPHDAIARRSAELFEFLQLGELTERMPEQLSGGQRQRVALARALAPDPSLLLLDEPLGALDAKLRAQVQVELKDIQRRTGKTFVFVTHDQEEALTMSDRIIVMNAGRILQEGSPETLYHRPANRFVAEFIGEINLLAAEVVGRENTDRLWLDWSGLRLSAAAPDAQAVTGRRIDAAIRPEAIRCLAPGDPVTDDTVNLFDARVERRIFRGSRVSLDLALGERVETSLKATVDSNTPLAHLDALRVVLDPRRIAVLTD